MSVKRLNDGVAGLLERPALASLASRLPFWIAPDHLTVVGFAGAMLTAAGYLASHWSLQWLWVSTAGLVLNWAGDSLDGTVARLRRIERPRYGFFVDRTADLFSKAQIFLALGLSPCARFEVASLGLIALLMASVYSLICSQVRGTLRITYLGFGPTEIRALLVVSNVITLFAGVVDVGRWISPLAWFGPVTIYELLIVLIAVVTVPTIAWLTIRESRDLAREDPGLTTRLHPDATRKRR